MGSGGLRGLQILRSGASRVRGGFDSHAFPPFLALAVVLLLGMPPAPPIWADPGPGAPPSGRADSLAAPPSSAAGQVDDRADSTVTSAAPDSSGSGAREIGRRHAPTVPFASIARFDKPRWVMLRSLVVPGWGQFHNHAWFKMVGVAAAEGSLLAGIVNDERQLDRLSRKIEAAQAVNDEPAFNAAVLAYNDRLATTTNRRWWLGGVIAYALVDAYVDAHFTHFDVEFDTDPALPEGGGTSSEAKLSMRWTF